MVMLVLLQRMTEEFDPKKVDKKGGRSPGER
jgi:hypothetical protein